MAPKARLHKGSISKDITSPIKTEKEASKAMPPPPDPLPTPGAILEAEVNALSTCVKVERPPIHTRMMIHAYHCFV